MKSFFIILVGIVLIVISFGMKSATKTWIEQQMQTETIKGNKGVTTAVGATIGAAGGATAGAVIGGVGIVACGTGIGIPAGAVCLILAGIFGGAGAVIGNAAGKETQIVENLVEVTQQGPVFGTWLWVSVMSIGIILVLSGILNYIIKYYKHKQQTSNL
ncbi:MAG: hypothetical protein IJW31_04295 [Lentisphaeria bacterium]|nr:hypothetical protein [Lentisphaeria bacterium]